MEAHEFAPSARRQASAGRSDVIDQLTAGHPRSLCRRRVDLDRRPAFGHVSDEQVLTLHLFCPRWYEVVLVRSSRWCRPGPRSPVYNPKLLPDRPSDCDLPGSGVIANQNLNLLAVREGGLWIERVDGRSVQQMCAVAQDGHLDHD